MTSKRVGVTVRESGLSPRNEGRMDNETTTKNLVAAIRERDQRIAAMTEALLAAADHEDAAVASAVLAERARIRAAVKTMIERDYLYVGRKVSDLVEAILREIGGAS